MDEREFLDILRLAGRLKDTLRHCVTSRGRPESVAEHCWRTALMALLLRGEFPELDMDRVIRMCLIHDLGECFTGDIPAFRKTGPDQARENELLAAWVADLPGELDFAPLYAEMEAQETGEAKLYRALDKLEAVIQHNESPLETWSEVEYTLNRTYGREAAAFSPWLTRLREELVRETEAKLREEVSPIRFVTHLDREGWLSLDKHLPEGGFEEKVRARRGLVYGDKGRILGILRWGLFWDSIPFCTLLYVREDCRGKGCGKALLDRWEGEMAAQGHGLVLTSTQADETAQHFYRRLGYRDCGGFVMPVPGYEQPTELILAKAISPGEAEG